jgi:hypothetical protein
VRTARPGPTVEEIRAVERGGKAGSVAYILHRVAVAVVGGLLILLFFLGLIRFFALFFHLVAIIVLLAFISFVVVILPFLSFTVTFSLLFLFFRLYFRLILDVGGDGKRFGLALWFDRDIGMYDIPRHWMR